MKRIGVAAIVGILAFILYQWSRAPSPYAGLPPELRKSMEKAEQEVKSDMNSEFGRGAEAVCRRRVGISEQVRTANDVLKYGYGSEKAIAFAQCVVDTMYPDPALGAKSR